MIEYYMSILNVLKKDVAADLKTISRINPQINIKKHSKPAIMRKKKTKKNPQELMSINDRSLEILVTTRTWFENRYDFN